MTWPEVEEAIGRGVDAVLIPIGTTEQHGPHMPLDTDCFIARSLCARAAEAGEAEGVELLVAPTLNVTLSWYHMQFPGSIRLSTTTFFQVFREVCDSLAHHGFERLVAVNGHGGNAAALTVAVNHYLETTGRRVFLAQWWDLASDVLAEVEGPLIHAEEAETSLAHRARPAGRAGPRDPRRLGPRRGREGRGPAVDVARPLRDAPEAGRAWSCRWTCSATSPRRASSATRRARARAGERMVAAVVPADRPGLQGDGRKGVSAWPDV